MYGHVEEIRGRRGWTSPGEERGNETRKFVIIHNKSVETSWPIKTRRAEGILYGRETDRDPRIA